MTAIKLCGLSRQCDILAANELKPEYIGFVFAKNSSRFVDEKTAAILKGMLDTSISAVGVFVNEDIESVARLLTEGIIDIAQLHGKEDEAYIKRLRKMTGKPIIKAFRIKDENDIIKAQSSSADFILLDSGAGTGEVFDWSLLEKADRQYFLAGGLDCDNVRSAVKRLNPFAVDVSSGIEADGFKSRTKMQNFVNAVRSI